MKKFLCVITLCIPAFLYAQKDASTGGINWIEGLSWEQVKAKAKAENKYIFVDCFATWCGPCKAMDKNIYPLQTVGSYFNEHFLSIRVQMDQTANDDEDTRKWYDDAICLQSKYEVDGFPTYLFFRSDAEIVHRGSGYLNDEEFLKLAKAATDPKTQYYTLLRSYNKGENDFDALDDLALSIKDKGDRKLAGQIAEDYLKNLSENKKYSDDNIDFIIQFFNLEVAQQIAQKYYNQYLINLVDDKLFTKRNLKFVSAFYMLLHPTERFFNFFYRNSNRADSILSEPGRSQVLLDYVIGREEVYKKFYDSSNKPIVRKVNWKKVYKTISKKYGESYAQRVVNWAEPYFYYASKDWEKWAQHFDNQLKKTPPTTTSKNLHSWGDIFALNDKAWDAFTSCDDKKALKRALAWSELCIKLDNARNDSIQLGLPEYLDTKANILYRLGKVEDAIKTETEARELYRSNEKRQGIPLGSRFAEFNATIDKMKKGEPTWPVNK